MHYGPNTNNYIDKDPDSLVILEHIEQYAPQLLHLFEVGLDNKYTYAHPVTKAASIPYIIAHATTNQREMPDIDMLNLEKGLGGECLSIVLMTCIKTAEQYGRGMMANVKHHHGHEARQFTPESKRNHNFLSIEAGGKKIIFDPSQKYIQWYDKGEYTITNTFTIQERIKNYQDKKVYSGIGKGIMDYEQLKVSYKGCGIQILGYVQDTPAFLGLSVCNFNQTHIAPIITVHGATGLEQGLYFYDQESRLISRIDESLQQYEKQVHMSATQILKDFEARNLPHLFHK